MNRRHALNPWAPLISFWCQIWQRQIDLSLQHMARMAAAMPKAHSADLAREADSAGRLAAPPRKPARSRKAQG